MTDTSRARRALLATLMLAALATAGWLAWRAWQERTGTVPEAAQAAAAPSVTGDRAAPGSAPPVGTATRARGPRAPLPPLEAPFDSVFADLSRRAKAGDAQAACRLAAEFDLCERRRQRLAQLQASIQAIASTPTGGSRGPRTPDAQRRMQDRRQRMLADFGLQSDALLRDLEQCARVPPATPAQRTAWWRAAALGGHLPSLTQYAVGNGFRWREMLQNLPALQTYRVEAEALARRAAAAGDVQATLALAHAYASSNQDNARRSMLAQVVQPDDAEALAMYRRVAAQRAGDERPVAKTMLRSLERSIRTLQSDMTDAQQRDAAALAARFDREWQPPATRGALPPAAATRGAVGDLNRAECAVDSRVSR